MDAFESWCNSHRVQVDSALSAWVPSRAPAGLGEMMRYAVLDGGKRLRPLLVLAAAVAVKGNLDAALRAACAVELVHAYSLVHDDLPCMDNDVLRRNKPTVHVKYGQANALLAGDAMQALAFEVLTTPNPTIEPAVMARLCYLLANAAGYSGMAGGQAIDLAHVGKAMNATQLREMHSLKTGALIEASIMMGAACGTVNDANRLALQHFGANLGLAFQVIDDVLDVTADSSTLGKTAGKDADQGKPTYVSVLGLEAAKDLAESLHDKAVSVLRKARLHDITWLLALAHSVIRRQS